jgi:chromosome transmission fidelity protein 18
MVIWEVEQHSGSTAWNRKFTPYPPTLRNLTFISPLDMLVTFETSPSTAAASAPVRYAVRQVLDQEYQKNIIVRENSARQARYRAGNLNDEIDFSFAKYGENKDQHAQERVVGPKKDFFGRLVEENTLPLQEVDGNSGLDKKGKTEKEHQKIWVTYHEGFSDAVRKPLTVEELFKGL